MKEFKIRCSAIGQIMTNPRSKADKLSGVLSKTAQTYCETWLKEQIYSRRKEFSTKFTEKGNIVEDNSIDFVAEQLGYGMLLKNEKHYKGEFITGTPDVVLPDLVIDVKNSWDCFTFPLFETRFDMGYYWQAQGYMALTGRKNYKLIYTLMDTPLHLIEKEAYWYAKNNGYEDLDDKLYQKFLDKMTFGNVPDKYRIKVFDIARNDGDIEQIKERVKQCRQFINSLKY